MSTEKSSTSISKMALRFFGACFSIFGVLVLAVGLPKYSIIFILAGAGLIFLTTKLSRSWMSSLMGAVIRRPKPVVQNITRK
jgi:hypothetical protein